MQIIHTDYGRCLSVDGEHWQIQLLVNINAGWGSLNAMNTEQNYYRYGFWQSTKGLKRLPLAPNLSVTDLSQKCEKLIGLINLHNHSVPFPLIDKYEYWLLNASDMRPLVLLKSAFEHPLTLSFKRQKWTAQLTAFSSVNRPPDSNLLEKQIHQRAGYKHLCCWIEREVNGKGNDIQSGKFYPADHFPELLIREDWDDHKSIKRVQDYIDWISPALLTLQHLQRNTRARLEKKLFLQAAAVKNHYRLYPEIVNSKLINAALVQTRLQQVNSGS